MKGSQYHNYKKRIPSRAQAVDWWRKGVDVSTYWTLVRRRTWHGSTLEPLKFTADRVLHAFILQFMVYELSSFIGMYCNSQDRRNNTIRIRSRQ